VLWGTALACQPSHLLEVTPAGGAVKYLSSECGVNWIASSSGNQTAALKPQSIKAQIPGDLLTDLEEAGEIDDPLYERNWLKSDLWSKQTWTYSANFSVDDLIPSSDSGASYRVQLVFDGIKMGAHVKVNGEVLGTVTSQFIRYSFDLPSLKGLNRLEVVFDHSILVGGRFMASSGGWDWAPYTNTQQEGARTFTYGIWKHVYLVYTPSNSASIIHVVPQIYYQGRYPTKALVDGQHAGFKVKVKVFLSAKSPTNGSLTLQNSWNGEIALGFAMLPAGNSSAILEVNASAKEISLWWPIGMGDQPLYDVTVTFSPNSSPSSGVSTHRKVGFRYFALVTGNDTDPAYVARAAQEQGTESHGMYFRINGAAFWSKGSNVIPMENLEGRISGEAHRVMVRSAADGGHNTLRVWGGGIFMPDEFYEACDELGLIVFHDMMYAQLGHAPARTVVQDTELRHQVRRLSNHPSIVIWDGCNECTVKMGTETEIYATFVMTVVAEEDTSRSIWPSCPAFGWSTGVHKLDCLPNGESLTTPGTADTIETHGYYQHGTGFPAVNGAPKLQPFGANLPIKVDAEETGLGHRNIFGSEFGAVVMSSFESMAPTLAPEHWGLHGGQKEDQCEGSEFPNTCKGDNVMAERNYPCDSLILAYFGPHQAASLNQTGEAIFKQQLYQCMLSQTLILKSDIETRRSQNQFGALVWQLNEIWPTGGWGSVEYGTPVKGQVLGGRWKPLHYLYRRSIFMDVMATCGAQGSCYVKNDGTVPFEGQCNVSTLRFSDGQRQVIESFQLQMPAGPGAKHLFKVEVASPSSTMLLTECRRSSPRKHDWRIEAFGAVHADSVSFNENLLVAPFQLDLPEAKVSATVSAEPNADGTVDIELVTDRTALYVVLTTLAHGRFSDNAFAMTPGKGRVQFIPFGRSNDIDLLRRSLRVEHLQMYQQRQQTSISI